MDLVSIANLGEVVYNHVQVFTQTAPLVLLVSLGVFLVQLFDK